MTQFIGLNCRFIMMAKIKIKNDKHKKNIEILITKNTIKDLSFLYSNLLKLKKSFNFSNSFSLNVS